MALIDTRLSLPVSRLGVVQPQATSPNIDTGITANFMAVVSLYLIRMPRPLGSVDSQDRFGYFVQGRRRHDLGELHRREPADHVIEHRREKDPENCHADHPC